MKSVAMRRWIAASMVVIGVLAAGVVLPGCSKPKKEPASPKGAAQPKAGQPAPEPKEPVAEPAPEPKEPVAEPAPEPKEPVAEPGAGSKVSSFAPAEDLVNQVDYYVGRLEDAVQLEEDYQDSAGKIAKDSNTLIVIGLALGLHDQDNKYKSRAGALMQAAAGVAATKDHAAAKKAVAAVKAAAAGQGPPNANLKWEKVASLEQLMKQVPLIESRLKRGLKPSRFEKQAEKSAGYSAVIAVIAHGSMADTSAAKNDQEIAKWKDFCVQMRDAAAAVNAAVHAKDQAAAMATAKTTLSKSCDDCHVVFHPDEE